jgi:hypothetical protein
LAAACAGGAATALAGSLKSRAFVFYFFCAIPYQFTKGSFIIALNIFEFDYLAFTASCQKGYKSS